MESRATPVAAGERILALDVIRGFALLGIFIMNMPWFGTSFYAEADGTHLWPEWWNRSAEIARDILFSGKFNSMFSMLFAIGFTLQLERLEAREPGRARSIYLRRIAWLFAFGVAHATLLWTGDVLHIYALLGLVLLPLRRAPTRLLWLLFAACLAYPALMGAWRLATTTPEQVERYVATMQQWEASNGLAYGSGSFLAAVREHARELAFGYTDPEMLRDSLGFWVQIFSTMLVGLIVGRERFFQETGAHLPLVRRAQGWTLGVGLASGAVFGTYEAVVTDPSTPTLFGVVSSVCYALCRISIMAFYVATIVRALHADAWRRRLAPLATAGRMPLTNYLMQSAIATALFYGWGLGLWGRVGPAWGLALAFGIFFIVQVPLSRLWLGRFEMGPMEYLWRLLSYGEASLRRSAVPSVRVPPGAPANS